MCETDYLTPSTIKDKNGLLDPYDETERLPKMFVTTNLYRTTFQKSCEGTVLMLNAYFLKQWALVLTYSSQKPFFSKPPYQLHI